jgi:hypothetical protein
MPFKSAGNRMHHLLLLTVLLPAALTSAGAQPNTDRDPEFLGLYEAQAFHAADGFCPDCPAPKPALWYFQGELVAIPKEPQWPGTAFSRAGVTEDIRTWSQMQLSTPRLMPFLAWLASPELVEHAKLDASGATLTQKDSSVMPFGVVPQIASNRAYYNADSAAFFARRSVRVRGSTQTVDSGGKRFVARVVWPHDYRIVWPSMKLDPLRESEPLSALITAEDGGAKSNFSTRLIWQSKSARPESNAPRAVLAFMLNGAQGDDDETQSGHFAVVTGWHRANGRWADWMVNDFSDLDRYSEKRVLAAMLPMDNYLMDFNSGQAYYGPSYMLVAILRRPDAPQWYQSAVERVFDRFYRHHIEYDDVTNNCAGLSIDTLRGLGWQIPALGATSYTQAGMGYFYSSARDLSFSSGKRTFDYLRTERTRLYPRAAFEAAGQDLLSLVASPPRSLTRYEQILHDDVEAIVFVRIPQIPSSRAFGTYPVASFDEHMARVPKDGKQWKRVAVKPRAFPAELRDHPAQRPLLSDTGLGVLSVSALLIAICTPVALWYRGSRANRVKMKATPPAP